MQTIVLKLNLLLISACILLPHSFASEIQAFSKTNQWKNILYYEDGRSIVEGKRYFFSKHGDKNLEQELRATLSAFRQRKKIEGKYLAQCVFPARWMILKKKWKNLGDLSTCVDFHRWKQKLSQGEFFLVFSNAYANNPASMFGHTFLRLSKKGSSNRVKDILGYSFAFQARPNPNDNPFTYTLKGLFGGYHAYLMTHPYYINIGTYNNSEARDLWEYKLDLSQGEKELMLAHLWELSSSVAFKYYFFDENCSTFLLRFLEVIRPNKKFQTRKRLFVIPNETVQEVVAEFKVDNSVQRHSILKKLIYRFKNFLPEDEVRFKQVLKGGNALNEEQSVDILDAANLYWKYKNYLKKNNLSKSDRKIMFATLLRRSNLDEISVPLKLLKNSEQAPHLAHGKSLVKLNLSKDIVKVNLRYGFHNFSDDSIGYFPGAYISLFDFDLTYLENSSKISRVKWAEILSLQNFTTLNKAISWKVDFETKNYFDGSSHIFSAGLGISKNLDFIKFYILALPQLISGKNSISVLNYELGIRGDISSHLWTTIVLKKDSRNFEKIDGITQVSYKVKEIYYNLEYNISDKNNSLGLGLFKYY